MRFIRSLVHKIQTFWWYITCPTTLGARALVVNDRGQILLVYHSYINSWFIPGGGIKKNEAPDAAIRRELKEEVGIYDIQSLRLVGAYHNTYEHKSDYIMIYEVKDFKIKPCKCAEIVAFQFFDIDALPADLSRGSKRRIEEYLGIREITSKW